MKTWMILMVGGMLWTSAYGAEDSLFLAANEMYQEGSYEEALALYRGIQEAGLESADLYYNMGNAAFRSNNIGHAVLYYEKALKMDPRNENAKHNLEFVSRYRVDSFDAIPVFFLRTWLSSLVRLLAERTWSTVALAAFGLLLSGLLVYLFSRRMPVKKSGFFVAAFALLLLVVSFAAARNRFRQIETPEKGIILAPSVVVRSTPSETGTDLFILHEGTKVTLVEEVSDWHNIRVVDGREGWIHSRDLQSI
ncbi:MAG: tetratricopeptide repeat protein [Bacteroidales bacterium]